MIGISVPLSANIFADTGRVNLSAASIIFDTISVCAFSDTIISVNNPFQCDSIFIDSVSIAGDPDFSSLTLATNILRGCHSYAKNRVFTSAAPRDPPVSRQRYAKRLT